jgi:glucose-6-phosphate 1-dehydrogenase
MENESTTLSSTTIILLGAMSDLAQKKLLPALMDLFARGALPAHFHVLAFSRAHISTEEYQLFARKHIEVKDKQYDSVVFEKFIHSFEYVQGEFENQASFEKIKSTLEAYDESIGMCSSKLFYLAVPPTFYNVIFEQIASVKLEQPCTIGDGWTRILVEKPFGNDLENAIYLDEKLSKLFREEQIYRIDHYLAKDSLQNILAFRFSNVLFEDKWNKDFIEAVYIRMSEKLTVSNRGSFYDGVGALRDVGQNHVLQMIALIAMDYPETLDASTLREKRALILESLIPPTKDDLRKNIVKGQYQNYLQEKNVTLDSPTETYFALKVFLNNETWGNVPFYLEHGKALSENKTEITVRFRSSENCLCKKGVPDTHPNTLRFTISPEQKITLRFWVRKPGSKYEIISEDLLFNRDTPRNKNVVISDAYEEVLYDAICGDQTLFVSNREQVAAWKYITAILKLWESQKPIVYAQDSLGPASSLKDELQTLFY